MSFRKNLEHLRKSANLSQEDFAYKLGVSRQAVSKWESGAAYPETEKILKMCDIFNCTLDELMKDDVAQIRSEQSKKYTFSDMLNGFNLLLRGTFKNFAALTTKGRFKFLLEIFVLFLLILCVKIPFSSLDSLGGNVFLCLGRNIGVVFANIWHLVVEVAYFIVAVGLFVYIYKVRFLDRFEEEKEKSKDVEIEEEVSNESVVTETKVVRYDFGILSFLGNVFLFFVKIFVIFVLLPFLFLLFCSGVGLSMLFVLLFNGIAYFGPILLAVSFIAFVVMLLYVGFNFVLSRRSKWTRVFIAFVASILGLAFGVGISSYEVSKMKFVDEAPEGVEMKTEVVDFDMDEKLFFNTYGHINGVMYEVDDSLKDTVKVKVMYADDFNSFRYDDVRNDESSTIYLYFEEKNRNDANVFRDMLFTDLKNRTLRNYAKVYNVDILVISSQENIDVLTCQNTYFEHGGYGVYQGGSCKVDVVENEEIDTI
ncbi:MAG: helix-turn-helix transcriptional regulator [Candidatus Dojkabacteria bacterium]|jgi:transcriptional regulator with XRE-family HTH domain